jgi:hypothetical protein
MRITFCNSVLEPSQIGALYQGLMEASWPACLLGESDLDFILPVFTQELAH